MASYDRLELMAAHLFGVVKGAYTGATSSREGVLSRADGGTLFLDEIGNLSLDVQKALLTIMQDGRYCPVGSVEERHADIKLVVATNEDLAAMVAKSAFREDLYMRLNPATAMRLRSLRERKDDFGELVSVFLRRVCADPYNADLLQQYAAQRGLSLSAEGARARVSVGRSVPAKVDRGQVHFLLQPSSFKLLRDYRWPGNFRQLEMMLSNLVALTLVELVDQAELVEPENLDDASRPELIPILPRTVRDLLRPMEAPASGTEAEAPPVVETSDGSHRVPVDVRAAESLNAVSCAVERQYLEKLYEKYGGDLGRIAEVLLGDASAGRKVQLRMNQLGIKLRTLKRRTESGQ